MNGPAIDPLESPPLDPPPPVGMVGVRLSHLLSLGLIFATFALRFTGHEPLVGRVSMVGGLALLALGLSFLFSVRRVIRGELPWSRLWLAAVILLEWAALQFRQAALVRPTRVLAIIFEVGLLTQVALSLARTPRRDAELPEDRIADALQKLLDPPLARFVAIECIIMHAAVRLSLRRAPAAPDTFGYSRSMVFNLVPPLLPLVAGSDWFVINALIPASLSWLKVLHGFTIGYFVIWSFGMYGLLKARPHRVGANELQLHRGIMRSVRVPLATIVSANVVQDTDAPNACRLDMKGVARVEFTLSRAVEPMGLLSALPLTRRLVASADDASALCATVERRRRELAEITAA